MHIAQIGVNKRPDHNLEFESGALFLLFVTKMELFKNAFQTGGN